MGQSRGNHGAVNERYGFFELWGGEVHRGHGARTQR
ncbi:protein of unknown function [Candidatus Promineifilum breve]|uniref:Uncharacterized protein n=1 Tax=Candidatus Promineifilum breve TaxID=1806508 RepID=A0A170PK09_9CHLR|nr:protein of unknown function [Candidatus Promineifilum breve]